MSLFSRSALFLSLAMTHMACNQPRTTTVVANTAKSSPSYGAITPEKISVTEPVVDRSLCGLPESIREPDWPRSLSPTELRAPKSPAEGAFQIAVLPDTQYYVSCREKHLAQQTRWLFDSYKAQKVIATIQLGDLTEHNTDDEWVFVQDAISPLGEIGPLFVASGNHDYGENGSANFRHTLFAQYFGKPSSKTAPLVAEQMTTGNIENAYYRFPLANVTLGVLVLEWSPRTDTVKWARSAVEKYPNDKKIFVTHAYLYHDSTRYDWATHGEKQKWNPRAYGTAHIDPTKPGDSLGPDGSNNWAIEGAYDGEMLWDALLADMPGLFLTLNGHVLGDGSGILTSQGKSGNDVHQVLTNFQMLDEGGLGYLRLIEFDREGRTMKMKTYSPSLGLSATGPEQEFELKIQPPLFQ